MSTLRSQQSQSGSPTKNNLDTLSLGTAFKGSFANLVRLVGLSKGSGLEAGGEGDTEDDEDGIDDDEGEEAGLDEESLMWDAQTALIAHHTDLAVKLYTQAALPPFCSPAACLALGNLLLRGSTLADNDDSPATTPDFGDQSQTAISGKGKGRSVEEDFAGGNTVTASIFSRLFGTYSPATTTTHDSPDSRPEPVRRTTTDLVATGWQIPREGKRAVRDAKSMGVAAAWFVLGLGWLVQARLEHEKERDRQVIARNVSNFLASIPNGDVNGNANGRSHHGSPEEELLSFNAKGRSSRQPKAGLSLEHARTAPITEHESKPNGDDLTASTHTITAGKSTATASAPQYGTDSGSGTTESPMLQTPGFDDIDTFNSKSDQRQSDQLTLQMMYDLFVPLVHLYRHGHIQPQDPVALPPISLQALPAALRPRNESDKRRNVWHLGGLLSARLVKLNLISRSEKQQETAETERYNRGVNILSNYILAMTAREREAEAYFRNVVSTSPTGLDLADNLIRQAAKRLDILSATPKDETIYDSFPFPSQDREHYLSPPKRPYTKPRSGSGAAPQTRKASLPVSGFNQAPGHHRKQSSASTASTASTSFSRLFTSPVKCSPSIASLSTISGTMAEPVTVRLSGDGGKDAHSGQALSSLKRIQASSMCDLTAAIPAEAETGEPQYPSLRGWKMSPPAKQMIISAECLSPFGTSQRSQHTIVPSRSSTCDGNRTPIAIASPRDLRNSHLGITPTDTLRSIASSPQLGTLRQSAGYMKHHEKSTPMTKSSSTPRRRLPFEPTGDIATIDPELAAAEMSSALTRNVTCGVCGTGGVNFPNCRKCGLTFCSRLCRVEEDKAGNGKKHICGAWEARNITKQATSIRSPHLEHAVPSARGTKVF